MTLLIGFMEEMLYGLRFSCKFIKLIMKYNSTTRYTITLDRGVYGEINGKRGLRQGDPIYTLLF